VDTEGLISTCPPGTRTAPGGRSCTPEYVSITFIDVYPLELRIEPLESVLDLKLYSLADLIGFKETVNTVLTALQKKECRELFGLEPGSPSPWDILDRLLESRSIYAEELSGAASAEIHYGAGISVTDNPHYHANVNGHRIQSTSVWIALDVTNWNLSSMATNARTLIHELGHAFNMLAGAGGSKFLYDVDPRTGKEVGEAQRINAELERICIK
jgi:hypothetical protein